MPRAGRPATRAAPARRLSDTCLPAVRPNVVLARAYPEVVRQWLAALGIGVAVVVSSWLVLVLLARRLPEGSARDLARLLPDCLTTVRRLRRHPAVPRSAKVAVALAGLWVLSPIDLIPEFLPVIGPLDDVVVVALALRYAGRRVPREVLLEAWPGRPEVVERLLGPARAVDVT